MSKKKGLSFEEKKQRLLELLWEKKDVFQLKDLEKLAAKEKGVVTQSVKEVLQSLVDDGSVESDKIGTLVCFWAFPSKRSNARMKRLADTKAEVSEFTAKKERLQRDITANKDGRGQTDDWISLHNQLLSLEAENAKLEAELSRYSDCNPERLANIEKEAALAKVAANRWTDNIFAIRKWCQRKLNITESALNKQFGIPDELDYLD